MDKNVAYFFSDAHLGVTPSLAIDNREFHLVNCLKKCATNASHIVFIGDLFEFWYEYKYYVSRDHVLLYRTLASLVDSGIEVYYLSGNHDFALGDFFEKSLGVQTSRTLILDIQGTRVSLQHGDGLASSDKGYRIFRKVLDFPLNRKLFSWVHPDLGMSLAKCVGQNSRKYGENRKIALEEYLEAGKAIMTKDKSQMFIHGHHHIAGIWNTEVGTVASPGQWLYQLNYLKMENGKLELLSYNKDYKS